MLWRIASNSRVWRFGFLLLIALFIPLATSAQLVIEPDAQALLSELANSRSKARTYSAKSLMEVRASTSQGRQYLNQLITGEFKRGGKKVSAVYRVEDIVNDPDMPEGWTPGGGDPIQRVRAMTLDGVNYCSLTEGSNYVIKMRLAANLAPPEEITRSINMELWDPVAGLFSLRTGDGFISPEERIRSLVDRVSVKARISVRENSDETAVLQATLDDFNSRVFAELSLGKSAEAGEWAIRRFVRFAEDGVTILEESLYDWRTEGSSVVPVSLSIDQFSLLKGKNQFNQVLAIVIHVTNFDTQSTIPDAAFDCDQVLGNLPNTTMDDVEHRPDYSDPKYSKLFPMPESVGRFPLNVRIQRNSNMIYLGALALIGFILAAVFVRGRRDPVRRKRPTR